MQLRKWVWLSVISVLALQACGGGGGGGGSSSGGASGNGGLPPEIPTATVNGKAVDGLILNGTVSAYDYSKGTKGSLLGTATTDSNGNYSLTLQVESRPILLAVTGGYYVEEASGTAVNLQPDEFMTALVNFKTGTPVTIAITPWTHIAVALANYNFGKGAVLSDAIDAANKQISDVLGIDITTTIPADVTDGSNQSAILSPAIQYGWMSAAISTWTLGATPAGTTPHIEPYTSIRFAQLMYDDVLHDGVLDGVGTTSYLSFSTTPLTTNMYRLGLAQAMLLFTSNTHNATGLTSSQLLNASKKYANNGDQIWGGVLPVAFTAPSIVISSPQSNAWARQKITVQGSVIDAAGIFGSAIAIDGNSQTLGFNGSSQGSINFSIDTTTLTDGAHTVTINATNNAGLETTNSFTINVDNTPPTLTVAGYVDALPSCYLTGNATDNLSGIANIKVTANVTVPSKATYSISINPSTLPQNPFSLGWGFFNNPYDFLSAGKLQDGTAFPIWFESDLFPSSYMTAVTQYIYSHPSTAVSAAITTVLTDAAGNTTTINGIEAFNLTLICGGYANNP